MREIIARVPFVFVGVGAVGWFVYVIATHPHDSFPEGECPICDKEF